MSHRKIQGRESGPLEEASIGEEPSNRTSASHPKGTNRSSGGTKCPPPTTLRALATTVRASASEGVEQRRRALCGCQRGCQRGCRRGKRPCKRLRPKPITTIFPAFPEPLDATRPAQRRADRRRGEPADSVAPYRSASARRSTSPGPGGRVWQCLARARAADAPESRKPAAHSKEWPRVSACIAPAFVSEETPGK